MVIAGVVVTSRMSIVVGILIAIVVVVIVVVCAAGVRRAVADAGRFVRKLKHRQEASEEEEALWPRSLNQACLAWKLLFKKARIYSLLQMLSLVIITAYTWTTKTCIFMCLLLLYVTST